MTPTRIHHINFVVRDLEAAILRYETLLGLTPFTIVEHALRGSRIATSPIGESMLVLVCPDDDQSVPGRFLRDRGEGFFLLSFGVQDLESALQEMPGAGAIRRGIDDWRVADIETLFGASLQLTEDSGKTPAR